MHDKYFKKIYQVTCYVIIFNVQREFFLINKCKIHLLNFRNYFDNGSSFWRLFIYKSSFKLEILLSQCEFDQ